MADNLISRLSGSGDISVRPLNAVLRYNSLKQDPLAAAASLRVDAVLDGSIQTSGDRIRVSARLIRTSDGKQSWAGQFDEKFTDIFSVQDSISQKVRLILLKVEPKWNNLRGNMRFISLMKRMNFE